MSLPRRVLPGQFILITRRCEQRSEYLTPSEESNQIVLYAVAEGAIRYGIDIIALSTMSNHYHSVVFDRFGNIVPFIEHVHKYIARAMNELLGRKENFWSSDPPSWVPLIGAETVADKILYVLMNPVKAKLVERVSHWPGVSSYSALVNNRELVIHRPRYFFASDGKMPAEVRIRYVIPTELGLGAPDEVRAAVRAAVAREEAKYIAERRKTGERVKGRRAVLRQDPYARPAPVEKKSQINPRIAAKSKWARIEALLGLRAFYDAYRRAREAYLLDTNTVFPYGTYWLRRHMGVQVAGPPKFVA